MNTTMEVKVHRAAITSQRDAIRAHMNIIKRLNAVLQAQNSERLEPGRAADKRSDTGRLQLLIYNEDVAALTD